jgi:hypothetical protein
LPRPTWPGDGDGDGDGDSDGDFDFDNYNDIYATGTESLRVAEINKTSPE